MTGVQTCALPICFPVTIMGWELGDKLKVIDKTSCSYGWVVEFVEFGENIIGDNSLVRVRIPEYDVEVYFLTQDLFLVCKGE